MAAEWCLAPRANEGARQVAAMLGGGASAGAGARAAVAWGSSCVGGSVSGGHFRRMRRHNRVSPRHAGGGLAPGVAPYKETINRLLSSPASALDNAPALLNLCVSGHMSSKRVLLSASSADEVVNAPMDVAPVFVVLVLVSVVESLVTAPEGHCIGW